MRAIVVLLTGLLVLTHSVFGCCGQHAQLHAACCESSCSHQMQHADGVCESECEGRVAANDAHDSDAIGRQCAHQHHPGPSHHCVHDSCQWIAAKDASSLNWRLAAAVPHVAVAVITESIDAGPTTWTAWCVAPNRAPLRLHLQLGVLRV